MNRRRSLQEGMSKGARNYNESLIKLRMTYTSSVNDFKFSNLNYF